MPLELQRLNEVDIPEWVDLMIEAFRTTGFGIMMHPRPLLPERRQLWIDVTVSGLKDPNTTYWKVVDTETGAMVAATKWRFYPEGIKKELVDLSHPRAPPFSDSNDVEPLFLDWMLGQRKLHVAVEPSAMLQVLTVSPDHQRRGIGALVLNWGCAEADRLGLPVYLEATSNGKPLYERFGFKEVDYKEFDLSRCKQGYDGAAPAWAMVRPAQHQASS